jgi:hypothetical protein
MSGRAAAQLELLGFADVRHYLRGKADWMVRGLPCDPSAPLGERLYALPFFLNNLAPGVRNAWIRYSRRRSVGELARDDLAHIAPYDPVPAASSTGASVIAIVLNEQSVVLGAIEGNRESDTPLAEERPAIDCMNPAPQTIRPDMTLQLAASLLKKSAYLLITGNRGEYIGRYSEASI